MKVNLVKNTIFSGLSNLSNILLLILLILAGRYLGAEDFGKLTFALAFVTAVGLLADFGLTELTKRTVARDATLAEQYFGNVLTWKFILSLATWLLIIITIYLLKSDFETRLIVIILGLAIIFRSLKAMPLIFCQALERFDLYAFLHSSHNLILLICGSIILILGGGLVEFVIVFTAVKLSDVIVAYIIIHRKVVKIRPRFDFLFIRETQIKALPFGLFAVVMEIYCYADTVMLSMMRSDFEVGLYNAAYRTFEGLVIFPMILCQAISPQLARVFKNAPEAHVVLSQRAIKLAVIVAVIVAGCGILFAHDVIALLFGKQFYQSSTGLQILLLGFIFLFLNFVIHTILISIDCQRVLTPLVIFSLVCNIGLNAILIPIYGFIGAAVATVLSEAILFICGYIYLINRCSKISILNASAGAALAGGAVILFILLLGVNIHIMHLLLIVPLYMFFLVVFKVFDKEELEIIQQTLIMNWNRLRFKVKSGG